MKIEEKLYPLTSAQKMGLFIIDRRCEPRVLNIGMSVFLSGDIDIDVLKESVAEAYSRWESMRIRFCKDESGRYMQYIAEEKPQETEVCDLSELSDIEVENTLKEWSSVPFELLDTQMNKIVIVKLAKKRVGVYLRCQCMTMDEQSATLFLQDVIKIYASKAKGEKYPEPTSSYVEALEKELEYESSQSYSDDKAYWQAFIDQPEPYYADIKGPSQLAFERKIRNFPFLRACMSLSTELNSTIAKFHLEPEPTKRILNFCEHHGVTVESFLLTALRTYISKVNYNQSDISVTCASLRRTSEQDKYCGGTRVRYFPCRTQVNSEEVYIDAIKKVEQVQARQKPHTDYDTIEFLKKRAERYNNTVNQTYECMTFLYQPQEFTKSVSRDIKCELNHYSSGYIAKPLCLYVVHRMTDGGLDFEFAYQKSRFSHEDLNGVYYYLCKIMFTAMENCYATVGDIISRV